MLTITIPSRELYDEKSQMFFNTKEQTLRLEHSLVSISKWESKWRKAFLKKDEKTNEEFIDYIKCMTITQNVDPNIYNFLTRSNINEIIEYIDNPMTATTFANNEDNNSREVITSELIYYWMISFNIPMECQRWHLNRLLTLIRVCSIKNTPPKKMNKREVANRYAKLNAARRNKMNSKG